MISFAYTLPIRSELRDFATFGNEQSVRVFGNSVLGDMSSEIWIYDVNSLLTDNNTTVLKPTAKLNTDPGRWILFEKMYLPDYVNAKLTAGGAGNVVFYLTKDGTSTGTALFSNVLYVNPIVNNSGANYTYGWSLSTDKKVLTVNVKTNVSTNALLNLLGGLVPVLSPPSNVADGVNVSILVKGT